VPELTVTAVLIVATSATVYGYAGAGAAVLTVIIWAVVLLVLLRGLVTPAPVQVHEQTGRTTGRTSFTGFWRQRSALTNATASMVSYDADLRPTLQHLLAARLAERHDVNLYQDPSGARRILLGGTGRGTSGGRDDELWYWLDPSRPTETKQQTRGIPPRTLAAIIDRLERL
jgi:hypothetical protein